MRVPPLRSWRIVASLSGRDGRTHLTQAWRPPSATAKRRLAAIRTAYGFVVHERVKLGVESSDDRNVGDRHRTTGGTGPLAAIGNVWGSGSPDLES